MTHVNKLLHNFKGQNRQCFGDMGLMELIKSNTTTIIFLMSAVYQKKQFRTHSHRKSIDYAILSTE